MGAADLQGRLAVADIDKGVRQVAQRRFQHTGDLEGVGT
jgi:hypothetical protein